MKLSLGIWLALCLAGLQFVAVTLVVLSSFVSSERVLLDHARNLLRDVGTNTIEHANGFLDPARGAAILAARLAENRIVLGEDRKLLEQLLFQQLRIAPQFAGVFYGDEEGGFVYVKRSDGPGPFRTKIVMRTESARKTDLIWRDADFSEVGRKDDPADTYDPRTRPWYQTAKEERRSIWTDPYIFFSSQQPGITIASPVLPEDRDLKGVIGVDIEIDEISDFLAHLKIGESGTAIILNRNGDVIAHPQRDLIKAVNSDGTFRFAGIGEIDDPVARAAFGHLAETGIVSIDEETYAKFEYAGATYVSIVMPLISEELPWTIAVFAPEDDFIGEIKENRIQNIWIAVGLAIATAIIGLILANYIHAPVRAFAVRSALISQGEIDAAEPQPQTYKELEEANETLLREISQRKKSEHEYGQTFDLAPRGMAQVARDTGRFIRVNAKFADITGYTPEELLGKAPADLNHPDETEHISRPISNEDEEVAINSDRRWIRKDGETVWVHVNSIMIRDDQGNPLHELATIDDITSAKLAEAQIQKLNQDLSHIARGELLGQMAAGLAHELNQPLTAITQNTDAALMTMEEAAGRDGELGQILTEIDRQAHRAGDIIKALRSFARKSEESKVVFDLDQLLKQSLRLVQPQAKENAVRISVASDDLPKVVGTPVEIAQVIINLLRNAIESIAAGEGGRRQVAVKARVEGENAEVAVEDSGPGVDPDIDLFAQFETTKKDGMGLGLSICRAIVEAGGGKLWHDADFEGGARFCFTVPLSRT
ncbi:MAG: cache domain-containing protein [Pseudomonadota bacterium]